MKGLIVFYVNHHPENGDDPMTVIELIQKYNKEIIEKLTEEGYKMVYVPTINESTRVDRVNLEGGF